MYDAIKPHLAGRYAERLRAPQPATGTDALVFERVAPPVTRPRNGVEIAVEAPVAGAIGLASAAKPEAMVKGLVRNAPAGAALHVEVQTNAWYPQGEPITQFGPGGAFERLVILGGSGEQQCRHTVRLRLMAPDNRLLQEVYIDRIARVDPDSAGVACLRQ